MGRDQVYSSVPYHLIGRKVKVIYTRSLVKIFSPEGERVAVHMRCTVPGRYCTVEAHMPSYYNDYVNLSPQKYMVMWTKVVVNIRYNILILNILQSIR